MTRYQIRQTAAALTPPLLLVAALALSAWQGSAAADARIHTASQAALAPAETAVYTEPGSVLPAPTVEPSPLPERMTTPDQPAQSQVRAQQTRGELADTGWGSTMLVVAALLLVFLAWVTLLVSRRMRDDAAAHPDLDRVPDQP